jgi:predicted lipoprotein with Yx(FWY)xxD motif
MQKSSAAIIGIIIVIVIAVGGYAIFHKSPTKVVTTSTSYATSAPKTSSSSSTTQSPATTSSAVLLTKTNASVGQYLTDPSGDALYTYGGDSAGVSNCTGSCLANWPAYQDKGSTSGLPTNVSTLKRTDNGETQYTYKGMPLYTFEGDTPGQVTGNGVSNFQVAKP